MKYQNAGDVLPPELLREVRRYIPWGMLYIPCDDEQPRQWGKNSGTRAYYRERNGKIRDAWKCGASVAELAQTYLLSEKTIRRIVYTQT